MYDMLQPIAASSAALTEQYRVVTQNLANASTQGYKRMRSHFQQTLAAAQAQASGSADGSSGLSPAGLEFQSSVDFAQGHFVQTGRKLDLAINGKGFFTVETPEGPLYTRSGCFATNAQGQLVDTSGRIVSGENGPITIPSSASPESVEVGSDGTVSAGGASLGKIKIVDFADPTSLTEAGGAYFRSDADPQPADLKETSVQQGVQEASNVNIVNELVELIRVSRMYEANMKSISSQDDRMKEVLRVATS